MSVLLFRLNDVGIDEAEEVRELLGEHQLDYYETSSGRWGLSVAGIWLKDESQLQHAKNLLKEYAIQRQQRFRTEQINDPLNHKRNLFQRALAAPLQYFMVALSLAIIIYFTLWPFLSMVDR